MWGDYSNMPFFIFCMNSFFSTLVFFNLWKTFKHTQRKLYKAMKNNVFVFTNDSMMPFWCYSFLSTMFPYSMLPTPPILILMIFFADHRWWNFIQHQHSSSRCGLDIHVAWHDPKKCGKQIRHGYWLEHGGSAYETGWK